MIRILALFFPFAALVAGLIVGIKSKQWRSVGAWYVKSTLTYLVGIPVTLLGLIVVPLALPYRKEHPETLKPFTDPAQLPGVWVLVTLPFWAKWWSNEFDGAWGDKRGWWNTYCRTNYKKGCAAFYSMFQWLAIRNPANYYSRVVSGCDVSKCIVTCIAGQELADEDTPGWSFLVATEESGKRYHLLQFWIPLTKTHGILGRFGWKIKMSHNGTAPDAPISERIKASVYRVSPWKST